MKTDTEADEPQDRSFQYGLSLIMGMGMATTLGIIFDGMGIRWLAIVFVVIFFVFMFGPLSNSFKNTANR